jgi:hypothetical protein
MRAAAAEDTAGGALLALQRLLLGARQLLLVQTGRGGMEAMNSTPEPPSRPLITTVPNTKLCSWGEDCPFRQHELENRFVSKLGPPFQGLYSKLDPSFPGSYSTPDRIAPEPRRRWSVVKGPL